MILACLQIYRELLSFTTFLEIHSKLKAVSSLSWQNMYSNLKTICHNKLKFLLWTELIDNLFLAKYLLSVAALLKIIKRKIISSTIRNMPKKIIRSIENNLSRNGCLLTSNDTFQMFLIPINKIYEDPLQKQSSGGVL